MSMPTTWSTMPQSFVINESRRAGMATAGMGDSAGGCRSRRDETEDAESSSRSDAGGADVLEPAATQ